VPDGQVIGEVLRVYVDPVLVLRPCRAVIIVMDKLGSYKGAGAAALEGVGALLIHLQPDSPEVDRIERAT
jgi:hypothetical protein